MSIEQAAEQPEICAALYFSYGANRRRGLTSPNVFTAILAGERWSITRFERWSDWRSWKNIGPGSRVRFCDTRDWWKPKMPHSYVDVIIEACGDVDLVRCSQDEIEAWSQVEGWRTEYGRRLGLEHGPGRQYLFRLAGSACEVDENGVVTPIATPAILIQDRRPGAHLPRRPAA